MELQRKKRQNNVVIKGAQADETIDRAVFQKDVKVRIRNK